MTFLYNKQKLHNRGYPALESLRPPTQLMGTCASAYTWKLHCTDRFSGSWHGSCDTNMFLTCLWLRAGNRPGGSSFKLCLLSLTTSLSKYCSLYFLSSRISRFLGSICCGWVFTISLLFCHLLKSLNDLVTRQLCNTLLVDGGYIRVRCVTVSKHWNIVSFALV